MSENERPGGWVPGIGWVAWHVDMQLGDGYDVDGGSIVIVTRWADGSTPEPPFPQLPDVTELPEWAELVGRHRDLLSDRALARRAGIGVSAMRRERLATAAEELITAVDSRGEN